MTIGLLSKKYKSNETPPSSIGVLSWSSSASCDSKHCFRCNFFWHGIFTFFAVFVSIISSPHSLNVIVLVTCLGTLSHRVVLWIILWIIETKIHENFIQSYLIILYVQYYTTFISQSMLGIIFVSGTIVQFFQQTVPSDVQFGRMIVNGTWYSSSVQLSHVIGIQLPTFWNT